MPNLVMELQKIQDRLGYLPRISLEKLSLKKGIPGTEIFSVATFYSQFRLEKTAKYTIYVCTGTACHVKRSAALLKFIEKTLGIIAGEMTKNKLIKLETVNCIGACAKAPAIMINDRVYGDLDNKRLTDILQGLK